MYWNPLFLKNEFCNPRSFLLITMNNFKSRRIDSELYLLKLLRISKSTKIYFQKYISQNLISQSKVIFIKNSESLQMKKTFWQLIVLFKNCLERENILKSNVSQKTNAQNFGHFYWKQWITAKRNDLAKIVRWKLF